MAIDATRVPIIRAGLFTDAGGSLSFAAVGPMGAAYIRNRGGSNCFIAFDAVPANTTGDGRIELLVNEALNLDDIGFQTIGVRAVAGGAATVEAVATRRPGAAGTGLG